MVGVVPVSVICPPVNVRPAVVPPSSIVMLCTVGDPLTVTVKSSVASLPAEKNASLPSVHVVVPPVPSELIFQFGAVPVFHVPLGAVLPVPPAPASALISQY